MALLVLVLLVSAGATGFALRPALAGTPAMWAVLAGAYGLLGAVAIFRMWREGSLAERLKPRWGDLSIGIIIAGVLLSGSWGARAIITPAGTDRQAWLWHIYLQAGPSDAIQRSYAVTGTLLLVAVLEEVVWRGMVLDLLRDRVGTRRAWMLTALLYAAAMVPTAFTLADPTAGPNPLLVLAALGCGIFWSFGASLLRRLPPVAISHMVFTYFMAVQFRPPGL